MGVKPKEKNRKSKSGVKAAAKAKPPLLVSWREQDNTAPKVASLQANLVAGFQPDAQTVLAEGLSVELRAGTGGLQSSTVGAIAITGELPAGKFLKGWICDVRGAVTKPKEARAVVVVVLAGTTKEIEFPWGRSYDGANAEFTVRFEAKEPRGAKMPPLFLSVLLTAQRAEVASEVLLQVDSFDVRVEAV